MSFILALKEFNKKNYNGYKPLSFESTAQTNGKVLVVLLSPPHYTGMIGSGGNLSEAQEDAARKMLEMWREHFDADSGVTIEWEKLEKIAGAKIEISKADEDE